MPVTVPEEPKKYTTIYENFKGVDFTNDPSNVYKRRSPGGKNMLPDLDGRPYKRKGWKIEYSAQDFIDAAGSSATTVTPKRIHHFSLGGKEYLMLFNSLGVFYTAEDMDTVVKCQLAKTVNGTTTYSAFPPPIDGISLEADSGRTFFFEANGVAGLYTFVGTSLFRFDGQYYWEVEPYVPVILVACDAYGAGTLLDDINLLTTKRTVQYLCDGSNANFVVPSGIDTTKEYVVEVMTITGEWSELTSGVSYNSGVLTINPAPAETIPGEDNMRVTYYPSNVYVSTEPKSLSSTATKQLYWTRKNVRHYCNPFSAGSIGVSRMYSEASSTTTDVAPQYIDASFSLQNPANINDAEVLPSGGTKSVNAYSNIVTYRPADSSFPEMTTTGGYRTVGETISGSVTLYCSDTFMTAYNASKSEDYSACTKVGDYSSESGAIAAASSHQSGNSGTTYHYVYNYHSNERRMTSGDVSCSISYDSYIYATSDGDSEAIANDKSAFMTCQRATVYGSGLVNQVFMGASVSNGYRSRLWYSDVGKPNYFPDINYVEVGSNDTAIMGMLKCDEYLGVVKAGNALDSSIYLAYPTSFDDDTTYVVRQSIAGIGALSTGAFNILAEEPIFLSSEGVMAIEMSGENRLRNRSYFVDKRLCAEKNLSEAVSYVFNNMYYLSINNHCYVLDGSQKNSWANERTNLQYECYYMDNIPAQCFADMGGYLWFTDYDGNLCRFKTGFDVNQYRDEYVVGHETIDADDVTGADGDETISIPIDGLINGSIAYSKEDLYVGLMVHFTTADSYFSITGLTDTTITLNKGVPVEAVWDTIADDDGAVHFFKNLNKKGFVVSLLPGSSSGVTVFLKPDEKEAVKYGTTDANGNLLPYDYFVRKKVKKYKRLQIICENNGLDQSFGVDQIIKTYTMGNYSKNRG